MTRLRAGYGAGPVARFDAVSQRMSITSIVHLHPGRTAARRPRPWRRRRGSKRPSIEALEGRSLLNAPSPAGELAAFPPNETIDQAWDLGALSQPSTVLGSVGTGPAGAADVTWYHFQLQDAARVDLSVGAPPGDPQFAGVLSMFDTDTPYGGDPYDPTGHRLLAQVQGDPLGGPTSYSQDLGPGDYYVAVSGAGNTAFSPVIAGSGFQGAMGVYELTAGATDLGLAGDGPTTIGADPAAGAVLDSSPLAVRVEFSRPIDPGSVAPGQTVQLLSVSADGVQTPVSLATTNLSASGDELQLFPSAPLAPGRYVVQLSGDSSQGQPALAGLDGLPLGEDAQHPTGADESLSFPVAGIDGIAGATASDDTAATARELGDVSGPGIVQVEGAIGVDPAFNPTLSSDPMSPDPTYNPANQVDLYHFRISGPGRYAMLAEVFAGRIGSPLDPGLSLFELDPSTGQLVFIAGNNNTGDPAQGTDGTIPLFLDPALTAGLSAGDYYLAVADGSNTPSPLEGQTPGSAGIYDPNTPGSAQLGWSAGPYLLNLMVQPATAAPRVVTSSPGPGQVLDQSPTQISVQFSGPVDLQQLAYQSFASASRTTLSQVFVEGADGTQYALRFASYDRATNTATFQVLDGLPNGSYTLHLSGPGGLTDLAGDPLVGNDPGGDEVIPFTVQGPARDLSGTIAGGFWTIAQAGQGLPQAIGLLFPDELQAGVSVLRYPVSSNDPGATSTQDDYVIQVLQYQDYSLRLIGADLPDGAYVSMTDASGQAVEIQSSDGRLYFAFLAPGTYTVSVGGWAPGDGTSLSYQLLIKLDGHGDNAPPLLDGPAPALQLSFASLPALPVEPSAGGLISSAGVAVAGPVAGGPVGATEGGPGPGTVAGGSGLASPSDPPVVSFAQVEASIGLAGLGMGPLGGSGGQDGPLSSPTIQVALNAPSGPSSASGSIAVGLVTLTQMFAWDRGGEGPEPAEAPEDPVVDASDRPAPPEDATASVDAPSPAGPAPASPAAAPLPSTPGEPACGLAIRTDTSGPIVELEPTPAEEAADLRADVPAAVVAFATPPAPAVDGGLRLESGHSAARWVIAAATLAAVYRGRSVIRGLKWRKGTTEGLVGVRSDGPIGLRPPHAGRFVADRLARVRSAQPAIPHARRGTQAASPLP